jgi:putative inorganic carbon (HCO3(-)) transporter
MEKNLEGESRTGISAGLVIDRISSMCLFFLFAVVPLIINPFAYDYWYKPKIDSIYALLAVLSIAAVVRTIVLRKPPALKGNPLTMPLIAYGIASILSAWTSINPELSIHGDMFREEGIITILSYGALTFVFASMVETEKQAHNLLTGLLVTGFFVSLYAIIQYFGFNPTEHFIPLLRGVENRPGSTIGNPNFLGKFLVLILPLYIVYYAAAASGKEKYLLLSGCIISFCALILTFTRASWFSFFCSVMLLALLLRGKTAWSKQQELLIIAGILIVVALSWEAQSLLKKPVADDKVTPTVTGKIVRIFDPGKGDVRARMYLWSMATALIKERPLLGYGPDTHAIVMGKFNLEYARRFKCSGLIDRAHNNYLDMAIGQGLAGLLCYLSIIVTFLVWLVRTLKTEPYASRQLLYRGILAAVCGYLLNDIFTFSVVSVSPAFWSLLGLTISIKRLNERVPCYKA